MARYWSDDYEKTEQVGSPAETTVTMVDRVRWDNKQDPLVFDDHPVLGSGSPVTSDGIARAMLQLQDFVKQKDVELCYIDVVIQDDETVLRDKTYIDIRDAYNNGKTLILRFVDSDDKCAYFYDFQGNVFRFVMFEVTDVLNMYTYWISPDDLLHTEQYSAPYKRPNPEVLSITYGDTSVKYDGSKHASINIPKVPAWALGDTKPKYDASEVGAEAKGVAASRVNAHNNSDTAHADIRNLIANVMSMFNTYATTAQLNSVMQTVQGYASAVQTLRQDAVLHTEVVDDMYTNNSRMPLSAKQGMLLRTMYDALKPVHVGVTVWNGNNVDTIPYYSTVPLANSVPCTDGGGRLSTNPPVDALHCANKKYVDDAILSSVVITEKAEGQIPVITDCAAVPPINIKLFGKSTQDGIPSMENKVEVESHGESGSIGGKVLNGNIITYPFVVEDGTTKNRVTCNYNENGEIILNGQSGGYPAFTLWKGKLPKNVYSLSWLQSTENTRIYLYQDGKLLASRSVSDKAYTFETVTESEYQIDVNCLGGKTFSNELVKVQLELGSAATDIKPPSTEQLFTFQTPNGLRGIPLGQTIPDAIKNSPIHMSGVYWDGEQYQIADTKNENGKDVQRILEITINSATGQDSTGKLFAVYSNSVIQNKTYAHMEIMCDCFIANTLELSRLSDYAICQYGTTIYVRNKDWTTLEEANVALQENPITIYVILADPIMTDLTGEEKAQLDKLVMNYPNTTIVNDAGAYMEVEYVADPKLFITNNYVDKVQHDALAARVLVLEQHVINS